MGTTLPTGCLSCPKICLCSFCHISTWAALILPFYGKELALWSERHFSVEKEGWFSSEEGRENRKAGETRENGFSLNWKEGTVKLWQKVEQVVLQEPDKLP